MTTLYTFNGTDGDNPQAGLIQATDGNFYGTTFSGGTSNYCGYGCGTVFKITPSGSLTTLHSFSGTDGFNVQAGLVEGTDGNFYGTTVNGGPQNVGEVYKITPSGTLAVLYTFCSQTGCTDGEYPKAGLVQATDGNFYGTTSAGGTHSQGTVFAITPSGSLSTLYSFCPQSGCADGANPVAGVIQASDGNFYGTTYGGGSNNSGTVFKLTPLVPTTTVLGTAPNPSNLGQAVTMTAIVTAQNGSTPTGSVVFKSNGVQIGSVQLNNSGIAVLIYSGLPLGTSSLTAVYQGSGNLAGSTSNTVLQVVGLTLTSVISSPNPSTVGQPVTITSTVSPGEPGGALPTGTVSFTSNGTAIPGCTAVSLSSSLIAVCMTSTLAVGTDAILATYSGDTNYLPSSGTLTQIVNPVPLAVQFVPLTPCRVVDTRNANGTFGGPPMGGHSARSFPLSQSGNPCSIPASAVAYSLNVTVVPQSVLGYLTIWPSGEGQPVVSTLNSVDGRVKANAAIVPAGTPSGSVSVYVTDTTNVILDIDGYFVVSGGSTLAFYALTPCRVADTRNPDGDLGGPYLKGKVNRDFPVLEATSCNIPSSAQVYSLNFTAVPHGFLGYLTVCPTPSDPSQDCPLVSTLNSYGGQATANAAIVPVGVDGEIRTYASNDTDLIIDINGYFGAPEQGGLSLYAVTPCRVLDTRQGSGAFKGERTVDVLHSMCKPPSTAQAYVLNATVVPLGPLDYLALWPDGQSQPVVSTLNAYDGVITSNMAIVPAGATNGKIDAYANPVHKNDPNDLTNLILDISSYFAP